MQLAGQIIVLLQVDPRRWLELGESVIESVDVLLRQFNHTLNVLELELHAERAIDLVATVIHLEAVDGECEKSKNVWLFFTLVRHFHAMKSEKISFRRVSRLSVSLQVLFTS